MYTERQKPEMDPSNLVRDLTQDLTLASKILGLQNVNAHHEAESAIAALQQMERRNMREIVLSISKLPPQEQSDLKKEFYRLQRMCGFTTLAMNYRHGPTAVVLWNSEVVLGPWVDSIMSMPLQLMQITDRCPNRDGSYSFSGRAVPLGMFRYGCPERVERPNLTESYDPVIPYSRIPASVSCVFSTQLNSNFPYHHRSA